MPTWVLLLLIVALCALFGLFSWLGVRKLAQKHTRSAVADSPHKVQAATQQVAVILNPTKAQSPAARAYLLRSTSLAGWPAPMFLETTPTDAGEAAARQALAAGADIVIAGGGDGTVRSVAHALRHTGIPLGVLPLGTGNLLARNLGLDVGDIHGNVQIALFGHQRHIDAGLLELDNAVTGVTSRTSFMVIAGMGMDAEVINDTRDKLKASLGWMAYTEAGMRHLAGRRKKVSIALDEEPAQQRKVRSVLFANCGLLPGGIDFVPGALIDDGVLDIVVISPRSAIGWMVALSRVLFQHKSRLPVIDFYRSKKLTLRTAMPVETQIDGDPSGLATTVRVSVEHKAVLVRVGAPGRPG